LVLLEIVGPFFGAALLFTGLVFAGGEFIRFAEYLQKGESSLLVVRLFLLTIPGVLSLTMPMAMLLAALLGYGRLSGDSEIIALTASGASFPRVAFPCALFACLVSMGGLWFSNQIVPSASRARNAIIEDFKNGKGAGPVTGARLTVPLRDDKGNLVTLVHVEGEANLTSGVMNDVSIEQWQNGKPIASLFAPRAVWKQGTKNWTLEQFTLVDWADEDNLVVLRAPAGQTREVELDTPEQLPALQGRPEDIPTSELASKSEVLRRGGNIGAAREAETEMARRNALPFASLAFALIGAPLGVRPPREAKGVGFGLSVVITFLYWVGLQVAAVVAKSGALPAPLALALPNIACIATGLYLMRRVLQT
jgi:lipopolysaccharide export system permease protein